MKGQFLATLGLFLFQAINLSIAEPVGLCPSSNGAEAIYLADSDDCSVFYKCESGEPVIFQCPADLHFSTILDVCVYPEDANCNGEHSTATEKDSSEEKQVSEENGTVVDEAPAPIGECPEKDGEFATHLPHGTDCTKFYKCDRGTPVVQECPSGLLFNPQLLICDYPESAGCVVGSNGNEQNSNDEEQSNGEHEEVPEENEEIPEENETIVDDEPAPIGQCPEEDGEFATHLPHGTDCTKFYKCDRGTPVVQECPSGLLFNPQLLVCDYPESAGCVAGSNGDEQSSNDEEQSNGENEEVPEVNEQVPEENETIVDDEPAPIGQCPEEDGEFATHLPHGTDCTKFYKCDRGTPVVQECPSGLLFNPQLLVCDYPESAGCVAGSNGDEQSSNDEEQSNGEHEEVPEENEEVPEDKETIVDDEPAPIGQCPEEDGEFATHLPHGTDCTKFYKCDRGTPVVQECPSDLLFNPQLLVCDYPESAGCVAGSNGDEQSSNDEEQSNGENEEVPEVNEQVPEENETIVDDEPAPIGQCPEEDGEFATHLPHGTDCTKFYKCDRGTPVVQECPSDLLFNPQLLVCDYPESAGCVAGSNGDEQSSNDEEQSNGENEEVPEVNEQVPEENETIVDDEPAPIGQCPEEDGEFATHLPHGTDCTKFYKCDRGTPVVQECPSDLLFNPQLLVCDYPESAGCVAGSNGDEQSSNDEEQSNGENEEVPEVNEQVPEENETIVDDEPAPIGQCPEEDGEFATHLPHGTDCTKFYKCDRGTPVVQECPSDLLFNPQLLVCDYPESAGCVAGSNGDEQSSNDEEQSNGENEEVPEVNEQVPEENETIVDDEPAPIGQCPEEDGEFATHLPHGTDCTKFYKCDRGTPVVQECPSDLLFNPQLLVCDYPESAGCVAGSNGDEQSSNDEEQSNGENEEVPEVNEQVPEENETIVDDEPAPIGQCPEEDGEFVTHLPHGTDCTKFYKCDRGTPVVQECPSDLLFNPQLLVCDYPESAGCVAGSNGDEQSSNDEEQSNGENEEVPEVNEQVPEENETIVDDEPAPIGQCPEEDGEFATHLPHGTDCTKFYKCDRGTPVVQECPSGLLFNPQLLVCDYPESASCVAGSNGDEQSSNDKEQSNGENEEVPEENEEVPEENETIVDDEPAPIGQCPEEDGEFATHLPHGTDCTKFYKCDRGTPVVQECPSGLLFNPQLLVCDYPESAGCVAGSNGDEQSSNDEEQSNGENEEVPEENEEVPEENETIVDDEPAPIGQCPEEDGEFATHLPHGTDCTKFYKCDRGTPVVQECPSDLLFNPLLLVCDYPESAGCVAGLNGDEQSSNDEEESNGENEEVSEDNEIIIEDDFAPVGECPEEDGEFATHLPHATDCTKFYKCDRGTPVVQDCPSDLLFNPQLLVCDFPESAGCTARTN